MSAERCEAQLSIVLAAIERLSRGERLRVLEGAALAAGLEELSAPRASDPGFGKLGECKHASPGPEATGWTGRDA